MEPPGSSGDTGSGLPSTVGYADAVWSFNEKPGAACAAGRRRPDRIGQGQTEAIEQRIANFTSVGTRLFWVVHPATRTVWVLRGDGSARRLSEQQELSGEDVIPGFTCPVASLFAGIAPAGGE